MHLRRTTARIALSAAAVVLIAPVSAHQPRAAAAAQAPPAEIVFPVVGATQFYDDFGATRAQGGHRGNDLLAARHSPVVAAEAGTVQRWTRSTSAGCMLYLHGRSGTTYLYVHLNNDLGAGNDNGGGCVDGVAYAAGLGDGQKVAAGALLGFVGDSGDANGRHPHLHFELHPGSGSAVSPYRWLTHASHLLYPGTSTSDGAPLSIKLTGTVSAIGSGTGGGRLTIAVNRLTLPGGVSIAPARSAVLDVPDGASILHGGGAAFSPVPLEHATAGDPVIAWSTIATSGLRTEIAAPGALVADRIVYNDIR